MVDGERKFTVYTTVTFEAEGPGTRLTVRQAYDIHDPEFLSSADGAHEGWRTTLDKLERELARMRFSSGRSVFHAVFSLEHALSDKVAKARWFEGGDGYETLEREMDVRPGGRERVKGRWTTGMVSTFECDLFRRRAE